MTSAIRKILLRRRGATICGQVYLGRNVRLDAKEIVLGSGSYLGDRVQIIADSIHIGERCHFASDITIHAKTVEIGYNCIFFSGIRVQSLGRFRLGDYGKLSRGTILKAGNIEIGQEFWMNAGAEIGGGGWRQPDSTFFAGDRCHIGRNTHVNVAKTVTIGSDTAIGMDCTLATHAHWQPITEGYFALSGPITLGSDVAVYTRSVIGPGVEVGKGSAIAAGSVVTRSVKDRVLTGGVPAIVLRDPIGVERDTQRVLSIVHKHIQRQFPEATINLEESGLRAMMPTGQVIVMNKGLDGLRNLKSSPITIFLSFESDAVQAAIEHVECSFDLNRRRLYGKSSEMSESLRNMFFSAGVRFSYFGYKRKDLSYHELLDSGIED